MATVDRWSWLLLARIDGVDDMAIRRSARAPKGEITDLWWRTPWDWLKTTLDGKKLYGGMGYHGRRAKEDILILQKPGKARPEVAAKLRKALDVVYAPRIKAVTAYPTQKPQALGRQLLGCFGLEGDSVLDPFAGSGRWLIYPAQEIGVNLELWDVEAFTAKIMDSGGWP